MRGIADSGIWNRNLGLVAGVTIVNLLGLPIITPALPAIREALQVPTSQIGLVMAAYALPALVAVPLLGLVADRRGKKVVLLPCLFLFGAAAMGCMAATSFEILVLFRVLQGIAASGLSSLGIALIGDYFSGHDRVRVMGHMGAMQNVGSGLFPVIGGALTLAAWQWPFATQMLALPLGLWAIFVMPETANRAGQGGRALASRALKSMSDRRVVEIMVLTGGFIFVGFGVFVTYIPIFLADTFATNAFFIGVIVAARMVSGTIMASQLGRLALRFSYRSMIATAFVVQAAGLAIVPFLPGDWWVMITALAYGAAFGVVRPALQALMIENAPEDLRTTFGAGVAFSLRVAQTIAPAAAGAVIVAGGFPALFWGGAAVAVGLAALSWHAQALRPAAKAAEA